MSVYNLLVFSQCKIKLHILKDAHWLHGKQIHTSIKASNEALQKLNVFELPIPRHVHIWVDSPISPRSTCKSFIHFGSEKVAAFLSARSLSC